MVRWARRTVLAWSAGILAGTALPAAAKPRPKPGVYSNTYRDTY